MILDKFRLDGRVVLVTGAGRGIGRGITVACAEAGADLVLCGRSRDVLDETADQVRALGRRALVQPTDLREKDQVAALVDAARQEFGRIDVLINNAAGSFKVKFLEMSENAWNSVMRATLTTAMLTSQAVGRVMLDQGSGCIINISSGGGQWGSLDMPHYGAAKAGLNNLTLSLAQMWAPIIRVNAIAVGPVLTQGADFLWPDEEGKRKTTGRTLRGRMGQPEDIAAACVFLASDAADWITGQIINVNGGADARRRPESLPEA
ncbi:MAG TPA: SDR family oxidoreductase [Dehalococcoidia bacterium]|nr:SDR family oxidoreductase [Dehalococcoidia bacterium]